ncbi:MAG: endonuclease/exonuclease/phosphatase family protein, partial [Verrucomicrobia subdivision 3 bacterium]|nr:endonuclease/exonuclease/phosphatase family protein [Limisphaerales bacterium]
MSILFTHRVSPWQKNLTRAWAHRRPIALMICLLWPLATQAQTDTSAVIASWNIEGFNPITEEARIDLLAKGLVALDAEVIALQEVNPNVVVTQIVHAANALGAAYQDPVMLPQTAIQNIAVVAKQGISVTNPRFVPGSDLGNPGLRRALVTDVTIGKFDLTLIVVHLKSGRDAGDRGFRSQQCEAIASFIQQSTTAGEDDVLVVGDFNMIPEEDEENFRALNPDRFLQFISNIEATRDFTNVNGNFLDGYAISRQKMTEYVKGSFMVFPLH